MLTLRHPHLNNTRVMATTPHRSAHPAAACGCCGPLCAPPDAALPRELLCKAPACACCTLLLADPAPIQKANAPPGSSLLLLVC